MSQLLTEIPATFKVKIEDYISDKIFPAAINNRGRLTHVTTFKTFSRQSECIDIKIVSLSSANPTKSFIHRNIIISVLKRQ